MKYVTLDSTLAPGVDIKANPEKSALDKEKNALDKLKVCVVYCSFIKLIKVQSIQY